MQNAKKIKEETVNKTVFVICPIGDSDSAERKRSDQVLKHIIKPVVEKFGYAATRADHLSKPGIITSQIIDHILNDPLVIADLTGKNPNVFYELAVRHVIQKPIIQIIQKGERIPFDVSAQRTIEIDHKDLDSADDARKELERQIVAVEKDPTLVDSPISTAISIQSLKGSANPEQTAIVAIQATLSNLSGEVREIRNKLEPSGGVGLFLNDENVRNLIVHGDLHNQLELENKAKDEFEKMLEKKRYEVWRTADGTRNIKKTEESRGKLLR
jgi:hypothetical protein